MVILVTPRFGAVNDNTGTSLNDSAYNILSEDVVSADCLNGCDPSSVSYVELITEQQSDPTLRGCFKLAKAETGALYPRGASSARVIAIIVCVCVCVCVC